MTISLKSTARGVIGAAALGLSLTAGQAVAQEPEFDFTMAVIVSPGDVYTALTQGIPERIDEATDGRVQITVSDSLVASNQVAGAVRDGRVPMSAALHTYISAEDPRMGIFNLPGLINGIDDYVEVREAFWREDVKNIWKENWNAEMLADGAWCPTALFSKEPIHEVADFEGKRIRIHNPQSAALMSSLGAKPIPMPTSEVTPALERGVIDGVFTSMCVGAAMELPRVAPHVQDWAISPITGWVILVNADTWAELPEDVRGQISQAMAELEEEAFGTYQTYIDTAKEKFAELGSELWVAPKELQEEVSSEQYSAAAFEGWYDRAEEIGVDGQAYVEQIREALGREGS
ncbi:TRAP transporter substrate-binding protein DctP [Roseovarius indicus]|uniref:TRAP transporter substrate-binding protein DctP n=1 Tax=Roseovarius indicus TaxID=540747 RepID=UPI0007DA40D9|nr:TRAP transporter substrate-binding protein DctP [Roseovarius indicus]OAN98996.1 C4-dicarboxylate ABC transporter substrate-binding protein [Roseovarius indicus]